MNAFRFGARLAVTIVLGAAAIACGSDSDAGSDAAIGSDDAAVGAPDATPTPLQVDVTAVAVTGPGGAAPAKGDAVTFALTVTNLGTSGGRVRLQPRVTTDAFNDFADVPVGVVEVELAGAETTDVVVTAGPFVDDDPRGKRYALGRGAYRVDAVDVDDAPDTSFDGGAFDIGESDAVFTAVVYDPAYLERIGYAGTVEDYLRDSFTRTSQLFTPSSPGSDTGTFVEHAGGFDEMMGITQHFRAVNGLSASNDAGGFCEQIGAYGRSAFGLTRDWDNDESAGATDVDHHGFDLLVGLTPEMGGGAACGWLGVQVSGLFNFDLSLDRSQIILVHETGHLFGAPHCDPMQGYVMCAGEQHERYQSDGIFVWHQVSRDVMANHWR